MKKTELKRTTFKHIESEIYSYHDYKKRIKEVRDEIINGKRDYDENVGQGANSVREPGRPTEKMAIMLVTDKKLQHYENVISAVDRAFSLLNEDQQKVISVRYWGDRHLNWEGVAMKCNVHRNTALKYRKQFVNLVANFLGWE